MYDYKVQNQIKLTNQQFLTEVKNIGLKSPFPTISKLSTGTVEAMDRNSSYQGSQTCGILPTVGSTGSAWSLWTGAQ